MAKQKKDGLSRRDFLKGAAVVGAASGIGAMGLPGIASAATKVGDWMPATWDYTADVVVIGYGMAAMATAIQAAKDGSQVIMLEKAPHRERGGNSRVCGQGILAPPDDIVDAYKQYFTMMTEGQGLPTTHGPDFTSADTINFYVNGAAENRNWFTISAYPLAPPTTAPRATGSRSTPRSRART